MTKKNKIWKSYYQNDVLKIYIKNHQHHRYRQLFATKIEESPTTTVFTITTIVKTIAVWRWLRCGWRGSRYNQSDGYWFVNQWKPKKLADWRFCTQLANYPICSNRKTPKYPLLLWVSKQTYFFHLFFKFLLFSRAYNICPDFPAFFLFNCRHGGFFEVFSHFWDIKIFLN